MPSERDYSKNWMRFSRKTLFLVCVVMLFGISARIAIGSIPLPAGSPFSAAFSPMKTAGGPQANPDSPQKSGPQSNHGVAGLAWYGILEAAFTGAPFLLDSHAPSWLSVFPASPALPSAQRPPASLS